MDTGLPEVDKKHNSVLLRLQSRRVILAAALIMIVTMAMIWDVPWPFAAGACLAIVLVAAFGPAQAKRAQSPAVTRPEERVWPDASMRAVVNALPQPAFLLEQDGTVRVANPLAVSQFPSTRIGDAFALTFRSPELTDALRSAAEGRSCTVEFRERVDAERMFVISVDAVMKAGPSAAFLLVTVDDVTERLAVVRMRADFVANASHELRTPLASLTGFIETLMGPARDDREASEKFLTIMHEQAERMRRLIDDLLSLSRLEMRAHRQPTEIIDLCLVTEQAMTALAPMADELKVHVDLSKPSEPISVFGDQDELVQVFHNLIENGLRYGQSGGKLLIILEVIADENERFGVVRVSDFGPGIAAEHVPRLTERFYRVDVQSSRELRGTGLGLAIVKHIVARHRGRLDVTSTLGKGSTFTVLLQLAAE